LTIDTIMKKQKELPASVVADVETGLTELIPVETDRKKVEGDVDKANAKKLREVRPLLKPLDKKEKDLTEKVFGVLESNLDDKGYLANGKRSIATRSGVIGLRVSTSVRMKKGADEAAIVKWFEDNGHPEVVQVVKRVHLTKLKQAVVAKTIKKGDLRPLGIKIIQKMNRYKRTKSRSDRKPGSKKAVQIKEK